MEENTFLDYFPQYTNNFDGTIGGYMDSKNYLNARNSNADYGMFARLLHPGIAEQAEFDRENFLMDKGNAFNEYMFNKTNEWNSAGAQMERAKAAGINPMLAAAGITGNGTSATPMQSQGANVGMNTNAYNPFDLLTGAANTIDTITGTTDKLGKLIGFGKENKLNFDIARKTATKLAEETGKTRWEKLQLQKTFNAFCRTAEANADAAEQNVLNLQKLYDKYQAENDLLGKQKELTEEQIKTQEHVTKEEMYKEYEMQFKNAFRKMFGVQLNDSDMSMLVQAIMGGKGQQIIDSFSEMLQNLGKGFRNEIDNNNPIKEITDKSTDYITKQKNKFKHSYYRGQYRALSKEKKRKLQEEGIFNEWQYAHFKMNPTQYW